MPQTYVQFRDRVEAILQDGGISPAGTAANQDFATAELDLEIADALRDVADIVPHVVILEYKIESRFGQASTTSANNLVDTTKGQFAAGDVGKPVYNQTTNTWALITSYSSTSQVGLSKDIFTVTDAYKVFNKECRNNKQINISDITDYVDILEAEYPIGTKHDIIHISKNPDIIELDMIRQPQDSRALSSGVQPETEVLIYFNKRHKISQLTDLAGAISGTAAIADATTLAMTALQTSGTIEADQEFTIANMRGVYWITEAATIASNTTTANIYPPLQSAASSTTVITFKESTLTPRIEGPVARYVAGYSALSKLRSFSNAVNIGRPQVDLRVWAHDLLNRATRELQVGQGVKVSKAYSRR